MEDQFIISGCHGTIAEQKDEAFYDDRSDADDDLEKGKIKFPKHKLYGREKELEKLGLVYDDLAIKCGQRHDNIGGNLSDVDGVNDSDCDSETTEEDSMNNQASFDNSRVIFLSGYSGIGKSALVEEFVIRTQKKYGKVDRDRAEVKSEHSVTSHAPDCQDSPIFFIKGKFSEQRTAMAPFSAISDALKQLSLDLLRPNDSSWGTDGSRFFYDGSERDDKNLTDSFPSLTASMNNSCHNDGDETVTTYSKSVGDFSRSIMQKHLQHTVRRSSLIGPGTERNWVLRGIFPVLEAFLDSCENESSLSDSKRQMIKARQINNDYVIKRSILEFLSLVCESQSRPLILFLDDLQWADKPSLEMLQFLLTEKNLANIMVICAFRSNEVKISHPFHDVMVQVKDSRLNDQDESMSVHEMDLYNLTPDDISSFIADSISKEPEEVADLKDVVYQKTMGNIFYAMQSMEELVRKNALYYDVMCFDWRWSLGKVALPNFLSDDIVEMIKGKVEELPVEMQRLLVVMSFIPNSLELRLLQTLMSEEGFSMDTAEQLSLLIKARNEGMVVFSVDNETFHLAHDRIRQACRELIIGDDRDDLLIRISNVLRNVDQSPQTEWCLYVAVDHLNSIPPEKMNLGELAKLNFDTSRIAKSRAANMKENELLREGMRCLESSDVIWKEYDFTLEYYKAVIVSDYSLGNLGHAIIAIENVLEYAKRQDDKFVAYMYRMLCHCDQTRDYNAATEEGLRIMKMIGYSIPSSPSKVDMMKEEMLLNVALRNRDFSLLVNRPIQDQPILELIDHWSGLAVCCSREKEIQVATWRAIRHSIDHGIDRHLPSLLASLGVVYKKQGKIKKSYSLGNVAVLMAERFRDHKALNANARFRAYAGLMGQIESFEKCADCLLQCANDLELAGKFELSFLSHMAYFYSYFASGLPLNSLLESKFLAVEDFSQRTNKISLSATFQMQRQFVYNLRKVTKFPTELNGEAFHEREVLETLDENIKVQTLRDSSSHRLQLAYIFGDEECMLSMLGILASYPVTDILVPRLHNRQCFVGLGSFTMGRARNNDSLMELGESCLSYFKKLAKLGSLNAIPVYSLLLAVKSPNRDTFENAIEHCMSSSVTHLKAIANERYGLFLLENDDQPLAKKFLERACELYYEWGANGKAITMKRNYGFLHMINRKSSFSRRNRNTFATSERLGPDVTKGNGGGSYYRRRSRMSLPSIRMSIVRKNKI